jgi:hypothetical protein
MSNKITQLKQLYEKLFGEDAYSNCYIDITVSNDVVLNANVDGLLVLVSEFISLCESGQPGRHYHLDEAGMAIKCDKPMIVQVVKTPW